jgi:catechol 2,3-dioxygenase-like lactoylglutathione lyase family enzyme
MSDIVGGAEVVRALHHVQLAMPAGEEDAAEAFYAGVVGMRRVPKPPQLAGRGGCWFESGSVHFHLGVEESFAPARKAHPAFLVDDLGEVERRLAAADVEISWDEQLEGHERFYAADPFGNRLEFIAPVRERQQ